jgi:hypothetical protein
MQTLAVRCLSVLGDVNIFVAGRDLVCWEVTALEPEGPFRLAMHHSNGSFVEYFRDVDTALSREAELEALLVVSNTHGRTACTPTWITAGSGIL